MKVHHLLGDLVFHEPMPYAQPLLVDDTVRILRWMLQPGQEIGAHDVPDSRFYVIVLQGRGIFAGGGQEQECGPESLLIFEPGESHTVRALDEELVFVSFMRAAEAMRPERTGGEIGREPAAGN